MKKLFVILLSIVLFASCTEHPHEIWDYKLKVFYLDGTSEVLPFKGEPYINTCGCGDNEPDGVFLNPAHHDKSPCLTFINRDLQYLSIACGVKRFEVISLTKTTVDPSKKPKIKSKRK